MSDTVEPGLMGFYREIPEEKDRYTAGDEPQISGKEGARPAHFPKPPTVRGAGGQSEGPNAHEMSRTAHAVSLIAHERDKHSLPSQSQHSFAAEEHARAASAHRAMRKEADGPVKTYHNIMQRHHDALQAHHRDIVERPLTHGPARIVNR